MDVSLNIDAALFVDIRRSLGNEKAKPADITREALALFLWAARQRSYGRQIVAATIYGADSMVTTPLLDGIEVEVL